MPRAVQAVLPDAIRKQEYKLRMDTAVRDTSLIALEAVNRRLEPDQQAVFELLAEIGPSHDRRILEALNQKEQRTLKPRRFKRHWEINQVTARRHELVKLGLVKDIGVYNGTWNGEKKVYHFWAVQGDYRQPAGWQRQPDRPMAIVVPDRCLNCEYRRNFIRQEAEKPVIEKLKTCLFDSRQVSQAGSVLARHKHRIKNQPSAGTALLFR